MERRRGRGGVQLLWKGDAEKGQGRASVKKRCGEEPRAGFSAGRGCRRAEGRARFYEEAVLMGVGKGPGAAEAIRHAPAKRPQIQ